MVRTLSACPAPACNVTPAAAKVPPSADVTMLGASIQLTPASTLTWIFSSDVSTPRYVPRTVCAATLVMKSLLLWPLSLPSAVMVAGTVTKTPGETWVRSAPATLARLTSGFDTSASRAGFECTVPSANTRVSFRPPMLAATITDSWWPLMVRANVIRVPTAVLV